MREARFQLAGGDRHVGTAHLPEERLGKVVGDAIEPGTVQNGKRVGLHGTERGGRVSLLGREQFQHRAALDRSR